VAVPGNEHSDHLTAPKQPAVDQATLEHLQRASRIAGFDLQRLQVIAAKSPKFADQLEAMVVAHYGKVGKAQDEIDRRADVLVKERLAQGRYSDYAQEEPVGATVPGEYLRTGVYYDKASGRDVRRVVRIMPGEDSQMDQMYAEVTSMKAGARQAIEQFVSGFER
jgi:hypothetical protein